MSYWILGAMIRTINRFCLAIGGICFLLSFGRVIIDWRFWVLMAVVWVGFLAEWIVGELRQTIVMNLQPRQAQTGEPKVR